MATKESRGKVTQVDKPLYQVVSDNHEMLKQDRLMYDTLFADIGKNMIPVYSNIDQANDTIRYGKDMYDGTPASAINIFTNGVYGHTFNPASRWFGFKIDDDDLMSRHDVLSWLQAAEQVTFEAFANSNFYNAIWSFLRCGASIGTATMFVEEDKNTGRIAFTHIHPGQAYIADNQFGEVNQVNREYDVEVHKIVDRFGWDALPIGIQNQYNSNPYSKTGMIHSVAPRKSYDPTKLDVKNKEFASIYLLKDGTGPEKLVGESGFDEFPYTTWRYMSDGVNAYGWSPAFDLLGEVKSLHAIGRSILIQANSAAEPAVFAPEEMVDTLDLSPRALNVYTDPNRRVFTMEDKNRYDIALNREDQKRTSVRELYNVDFFQLLSSTLEGHQRTAFEVAELQNEKAALLGPAMGRLTGEALDDTVGKVFTIERAGGRMPEPPQILLDLNPDIKISYLGPLAKAQDRIFRSQGSATFLEIAPRVAEIFPEAMDILKGDEILRDLAEHAGLSMDTIRPRDEVAERRAARAQQAAQQNALDQEEQASSTAKNMGQAAGALPPAALNQLLGQGAPQ